jgi:hypothetical protein
MSLAEPIWFVFLQEISSVFVKNGRYIESQTYVFVILSLFIAFSELLARFGHST